MVKLNLDQPLDQQGPFHLILHKITDQLARTQDGSQTVMKQIEAVQAYLSEHPEIKVIDPVENVMRLLDRHQQYQIVKECQVVDEQCHYFIPSFVEFTTSDVAENVRLIAENSIEFPIVCKPSLSHCYGQSVPDRQADREEMAIIFNEAGLADIQPPCVAQSFVNHNARLFKIFIIGSQRFIIQRPSIKNLHCGQDHRTIFFNSNDVSKSYSSSHLNRMLDSEVDYPIIEPDETKMFRLVSGIQKKFDLDLLGIDVIIENGTGRYGVIDINAFPGYDGVEEFFPSLLKLIQQKLSVDIPLAPNRTCTDTDATAGEECHNMDDSGIILPSTRMVNHESPLLSPYCSDFYHHDETSGRIPDRIRTPAGPSQPLASSVHQWYYFTANFCTEYRKSSTPSSCGSHLERPLVDVAGTNAREQVVAVNGCAHH